MTKDELNAATDAVLSGLDRHLTVPAAWVPGPMTRVGATQIAIDVLRAFNQVHGRTLQLNHERDRRRARSKARAAETAP